MESRLAYSADRFFFGALIVALFGFLTLSRAKLILVNAQPAFIIPLFPDVPLLAILFVLFFCALFHHGTGFGLIHAKTLWPMPFFLAWLLMSGFMAVNPLLFGYGFTQWIFAYLAFLLLPPLLHRHGLLEFSVDSFLAWAVLAGFGQALWVMTDPEKILEGVQGLFGGNRAHVGLYFLLSLAVSLGAWVERRRWLHLAALAASLLGLLVSGSRAAQLGAAIFILLVIFLRPSLKALLLGIPVVAGLGFLILRIVQERASHAFSVSEGVAIDASAGMRLIIWVKSWEIINLNLWNFFVGIGYSNFRFLYNKLVDAPFYATAAHNMYLHYWVETGLVGLMMLMVVLCGYLLFCWRSGKSNASIRYFGYFIVALLFTGFTQESLVPFRALGNFVTLCFLMMGLMAFSAKRKESVLPGSG